MTPGSPLMHVYCKTHLPRRGDSSYHAQRAHAQGGSRLDGSRTRQHTSSRGSAGLTMRIADHVIREGRHRVALALPLPRQTQGPPPVIWFVLNLRQVQSIVLFSLTALSHAHCFASSIENISRNLFPFLEPLVAQHYCLR